MRRAPLFQLFFFFNFFNFFSNLANHIKFYHQKLRKHQCPHCDYKAVTANALQDNHINPVHLGIKPYECDWCGHKFGMKRHLMRHKKMSCKPKNWKMQ